MNRPVMLRAGGEVRGIPALTASPVTYLADISEFQPQIADAVYLAWSRAIIIRAMYGDQHDDTAWYGGARRDGLHNGGARFIGIYAYLVSGQSGAAQAQAFRDLVGAIRPGEVFIADYEEGQRSMLTDWYNKMVALYGQAIRPHLWTYTGLDFGGAQDVLPVEWIAAYGQSEPSTPHKLWQFTASYQVPGVGLCDCNLYHGTIDELAALAYQPHQKPPADWTYAPPGGLEVRVGYTNFHATWSEPPGAPATPDHYEVWVYEGTVCNQQTLVDSYPRSEHGTSTHPDAGGLKRGTQYTLHVAAIGAEGKHVKPGVFASAVFTTA